MEVIGRDAALRIKRPFRTDDLSRLLLSVGDDTETLPFEAAPPFAGEIADIEEAALDRQPARISLADSRRTIQTVTALYEAARRALPVQL
jgi:predicted dehydrogenase